MSAPAGTYQNPAEKSCWETCQACYRCAAKGTKSACSNCSGRFDLNGVTVPDELDTCRCTEGVLQYVKRDRTFVQVRYKSNPFHGNVNAPKVTQDEKDWEEYVYSLKEKFQDENYDPLQVIEE